MAPEFCHHKSISQVRKMEKRHHMVIAQCDGCPVSFSSVFPYKYKPTEEEYNSEFEVCRVQVLRSMPTELTKE